MQIDKTTLAKIADQGPGFYRLGLCGSVEKLSSQDICEQLGRYVVCPTSVTGDLLTRLRKAFGRLNGPLVLRFQDGEFGLPVGYASLRSAVRAAKDFKQQGIYDAMLDESFTVFGSIYSPPIVRLTPVQVWEGGGGSLVVARWESTAPVGYKEVREELVRYYGVRLTRFHLYDEDWDVFHGCHRAGHLVCHLGPTLPPS